jgi:hypothetical protein
LFLEKIERPSFCREFEGFAGFVVGPGKGKEGSNVGGCWAEGIPNTCLEWLAQPLTSLVAVVCAHRLLFSDIHPPNLPKTP